MIKKIIIKLLKFLGLIKDNANSTTNKKEETIYKIKPLMSEYEKKIL